MVEAGEQATVGAPIMGRKIGLRRFSQSHVNDSRYAAWFNDRSLVSRLNLPGIAESRASRAYLQAYYDHVSKSENELFLALHLLDNDDFVGTMRLAKIDKRAGTADIGIMIGESNLHSKGLGRDAVYTLSHHAFSVLNLRKLTGGCMANNPAMVKVFLQCGFRQEACLRLQDMTLDGEYVDHLHFGCFENELIVPW